MGKVVRNILSSQNKIEHQPHGFTAVKILNRGGNYYQIISEVFNPDKVGLKKNWFNFQSNSLFTYLILKSGKHFRSLT